MTTQTTRPTTELPTPIRDASAGSQTAEPTTSGSPPKDASSARSTSPAPAIRPATPTNEPPGRGQAAPQSNQDSMPKLVAAAGPQASQDQGLCDTQSRLVLATDAPGDQGSNEAHCPPIAGEQEQGRPAINGESTSREATSLADPFLALAADVVDDLEKVRIANENRLRQLTRDATDKDGEERGFGLTLDHPDVARLAALVEMLGEAEHKAVLNLGRLLRKHPLGPWISAQVGIGEKQAARLLAAIGDPYWNTLHGRPRTVSELWAYAGYHVLPAGHNLSGDHPSPASGTDFPADHASVEAHRAHVDGEQTGHPDHTKRGTQGPSVGVAAKRARGTKANWSATAKMRAYLIAESCVKQRSSPYRKTYDDTRDKYAEAVHNVACVRCGPAGKPAAIGSPLSDGHKHARALRAVAKAVLKDLWREAKRIHEEGA